MATPDWTLRRARDADARELTRCVEIAYRHYIARIGKPPAPMLVDYADAIARHQVWVAEAGGRLVGGLVLIPEADHLHLDCIAVDPAHQGRGIGKALLELADAEALAQGYAELRLYTNERMTENIAMYGRSGWQETHRAVQDGYRRVFMRKSPSAP